jgi:DNA-binding LacI/PurR family transcriptional regulator
MERATAPAVTIKDIARKLGMSHTTVSRALNDHAHTSPATKLAVRRAAAELGYIAHSGARAMRRGQGRLIGLVIPVVTTDFYQTIANVLAEHAIAAGYQLILALTEDDPDAELAHVQRLLEARAAGIIIAPSAAPRRRTVELLGPANVLQLNRFLANLGSDAVGFDDASGIRTATEHLLALGHRRIAFIGATTVMSTGEGRLRGFQEAFARRGLEHGRMPLRLGAPRITFGFESMIELLALPDPPTAVVLSSSEITAGALEAVQSHGTVIPAELSVVGYTDPVWYRLIQPALTTVRLPVRALAETIASILLARIERRSDDRLPTAKPARIQIAPELIVRASTGPTPGALGD